MGMKKRHRMVKMSPADGSMCKAETSQAEKCMMPECREWAWAWGRWGRRWRLPALCTAVKAAQVQGEIQAPILAGHFPCKMKAISVWTSPRPTESDLL